MTSRRRTTRSTLVAVVALAATLLPACTYVPPPEPVAAPAVAGQCVVGDVPDEELGGMMSAALAVVLSTGTAERPDTDPEVGLFWNGFRWLRQPPGTATGQPVSVSSVFVCDVPSAASASPTGDPTPAGDEDTPPPDAPGTAAPDEDTGTPSPSETPDTATPTPTPTATPTATPAPPVAVDDTATTDEDVLVVVDVLGNDTDADGDTLTITQVTADVGTATVEGDAVRFVPPPDANGTFTFLYEVSDGTATATATATITVTPVNDAPVAGDDSFRHGGGGYLIIDVLRNDTDIDDDDGTLRVDDVTQPSRGFVRPSDSGLFVEFDDQGEVGGEVTFTYTVVDDDGATSTATVTVRLPAAPT